MNRAALARLAERGDDLRSPLRPTREALYSDDPVAVAARLLFCDVAMARAAARAALGEELTDRMADAGLVHSSNDQIHAPYHLRIVRDLFLFSDYLTATSADDTVMGAGETTAVLYEAARPRRRIGTALDLGCGAGTLALLLAKDCGRVLGTDVNPRAIEMSRLNAEVNGIGNAEFRAGSLWEPVEGERFDLIVSQPPYYPDTGATLTYLHGGVRGDELARAVVNGVADHLAPGGRALVFASWPEGSAALAPGMQVLELTANRRELSGSKQSLTVIEHPRACGPWRLKVEVAAECWGNVRPAHIDMLIDNGDLITAPAEGLRRVPLGLGPGLRLTSEGGQPLLQGEPGALLSYAPLTGAEAEALQHRMGDLEIVRSLLARGWLCRH